MRVSAVQLEAVIGDVPENLQRVEKLALEAIATGAEVVALPEFMTTRIAVDDRVHDAVLPPESEARDLLTGIAREHGVRIGGSWLVADGDDVYNRYHLAEPDGTVHTHDKDLPTKWENGVYAPGRPGDDGVFETGLGGVGAAVCWELIRSQTVRRMAGRVDLAITGTHWWTLPANWGPIVNRGLAAQGEYNRYMSENAPAEFARRLGAPTLQSSHCGVFETDFPLLPGGRPAPRYVTEFVGATQIVDATGHVLAQRFTQEGPGVVFADIEPGHIEPVTRLEDSFWIPDLTAMVRLYWHHQKWCGRDRYRRVGRAAGLRSAAARRAKPGEAPTLP